ncbi:MULTISPECIES: inner membrane protein YhjD [unclassified Mycobacterium]|uniref:inner membrane protein YhjD n=1 Tax=unclassified Mycobacterium TaxID=2642494 RepID=UPI0027405900|nr:MULTISPECIES: inner membrane protein YhjD [unclassified Mycobacterium]MDP7703678.1 inner membrane protein YhjD [Mycobacterium sp. TY815]MDP7722158.1 inner membrane protein YhjD [Mycobacterium sp. TY814]
MTVEEQTGAGLVDRLRARHDWLDHLVRAFLRFRECNGNLFAAGLTYYTLIALFPLLMIAFAVGGFALSRRPELVDAIDERTRSWVSPELGQQLVTLMNSAISAHTSVGVVGLLFAAWMGQTWMYRLREALCRIWGHRADSLSFARTIVSDLAAVLGTFAVVVSTMTLAALAHAEPMKVVLNMLGIPELSVFHWIFRTVSVVISFVVSWLVFSWVIVRLPRESVGLATSMRAGLMAAAGFELFKWVGSLYLRVVMRSVAGATFGPVLGLLVFAYVTWVLVLYSTAWAATASGAA